MNIRNEYIIPEELKKKAKEYAKVARSFTSDAHDFHRGGLEAKEKKMYEGKLGEKIFKMFLDDNNISYYEDSSSHEVADKYDFILPCKTTIDIKTRTQSFHVRTLEMVKQYKKSPKDIYVSVYLNSVTETGIILGWISGRELAKSSPENLGYHDNYVAYDNQLYSMEQLFDNILKHHQI